MSDYHNRGRKYRNYGESTAHSNKDVQLRRILLSGKRGVLNISYPTDRTKRGRVKERGHICPTIPINDNNIGIMEKTTDSYKIRRLTPRECFRLMGVKDEDIDKMLAINSETQLYKQAGNSIVVPVLEAIFRRMFIDTEPIKGEQMDISDFL